MYACNTKKDLKAITKWLKDSGLKVNESKTKLSVFYFNPHESISLSFNDVTLTSKQHMNDIGATFDL